MKIIYSIPDSNEMYVPNSDYVVKVEQISEPYHLSQECKIDYHARNRYRYLYDVNDRRKLGIKFIKTLPKYSNNDEAGLREYEYDRDEYNILFAIDEQLVNNTFLWAATKSRENGYDNIVVSETKEGIVDMIIKSTLLPEYLDHVDFQDASVEAKDELLNSNDFQEYLIKLDFLPVELAPYTVESIRQFIFEHGYFQSRKQMLYTSMVYISNRNFVTKYVRRGIPIFVAKEFRRDVFVSYETKIRMTNDYIPNIDKIEEDEDLGVDRLRYLS